MRLYLDDDSASALLTRLLRQGILVVRRDNNPKRDMDEKGVVRAIGNLLTAGVQIADCFHILNNWR